MEEENKKMVSLTKRGFWWYTLFSFLLVTLLIFTAVMITHSATLKSVGTLYAEKLALATQGVTKQQVNDLSTEQTYHNGENVFKVSYRKDGDNHVVYICAESGEVKECKVNPKEEPAPIQQSPMTDLLPMQNGTEPLNEGMER